MKWRYVPTNVNPADCASRGITPSQLLSHELWWHGPQFLLENSEKWPKNKAGGPVKTNESTAPGEADIQIFSTFNMPNDDDTSKKIDLWPLEKYSTFTKLQRIVAYCHRFIYCHRSPICEIDFGFQMA